jgi:ribonucleoside-diphosphate reductase alpha chain
MSTKKGKHSKGLQFQRYYTNDTNPVFDQFEYDYRTSVIRNPNGEVIFEMKNVEVPAHWSQIATDILGSKIF